MPSLRSQIVAAKCAALGGAGKPAGLVTLTQERADPFQPGELPAMNVRPANEKPIGPGVPGYVARKGLILAVDVFAAGDLWATACDDYLAWAVQAVMTDPRTGTLSAGIVEAQTDFHTPAALGQTYGGATVYFQIEYIQAAANAAAHA